MRYEYSFDRCSNPCRTRLFGNSTGRGEDPGATGSDRSAFDDQADARTLNVVKEITDKTTLHELATIVSDTLHDAGIVAALSGGAAVSIYTDNRHCTPSAPMEQI